MTFLETATIQTGIDPTVAPARVIYFGAFYDYINSTFDTSIDAAFYMKDLTFYNGDNIYSSTACQSAYFFQNSSNNAGDYGLVCKSGYRQLGLQCLSTCNFNNPYVNTCDQCMFPSLSLSVNLRYVFDFRTQPSAVQFAETVLWSSESLVMMGTMLTMTDVPKIAFSSQDQFA
jgi:hypothetical protein